MIERLRRARIGCWVTEESIVGVHPLVCPGTESAHFSEDLFEIGRCHAENILTEADLGNPFQRLFHPS